MLKPGVLLNMFSEFRRSFISKYCILIEQTYIRITQIKYNSNIKNRTFNNTVYTEVQRENK